MSCINDLCNVSNILDAIMFADHTNHVLSHQNINTFNPNKTGGEANIAPADIFCFITL